MRSCLMKAHGIGISLAERARLYVDEQTLNCQHLLQLPLRDLSESCVAYFTWEKPLNILRPLSIIWFDGPKKASDSRPMGGL